MKLNEISQPDKSKIEAWITKYTRSDGRGQDDLTLIRHTVFESGVWIMEHDFLKMDILYNDEWIDPPFEVHADALYIQVSDDCDFTKLNFDWLKACNHLEIYNRFNPNIGSVDDLMSKLSKVGMFSVSIETDHDAITGVIEAMDKNIGLNIFLLDKNRLCLSRVLNKQIFRVAEIGQSNKIDFDNLFDFQNWLVDHGLENLV